MPSRRRPIRPGPRPGRPPGHRPPRRRPPVGNPRVGRSLSRLRHANRCMETGRFNDSANIFQDLAKKAEDHGIQRAPQLYLQAGRAWILANDLKQGLSELIYGLQLMLSYGQHLRFPAAFQRVCTDLVSLGHEELTQELEEHFADELKKTESPASNPMQKPEKQTALPGTCPKCGAVVRPDELEWIDQTRAYCDYCGTILASI